VLPQATGFTVGIAPIGRECVLHPGRGPITLRDQKNRSEFPIADYLLARAGLILRSWARGSSGSERTRRLAGSICERGEGTLRYVLACLGFSGLCSRLPGGWRGEAVDDRGCLEPVRRPELAQDVRDVDADGLDADHERRGDLAVRIAAGDEVQDLALA
jgi:hypothetical protein